ncbi:tmie [Pungitius sinensis]
MAVDQPVCPPQLLLQGWGAVLLSQCWSSVSSQVPDPELLPTDPPKKPDPITSESVVFWGLRLWQVIAIFSMFILAIVITLCCIFKCRIPRTKKEIEARHAQRLAAKKYANTLETVPPLNELTEIPGSAKVEEKEEVKTVSGKVDADKGEKKTKEGKKEVKDARQGKGDEKDAPPKKGEKGPSKQDAAGGKGRKSGENEDKGDKGGKAGAKGGARKAQK